MDDRQALLRAIPKVDEVLTWPQLAPLPRGRLVEAVRFVLEDLRQDILSGTWRSVPTTQALCGLIEAKVGLMGQPSLRPVVNATGVPLHTNLGRAPLAPEAVTAMAEAAAGYSNLEYDLAAGQRGSRHAHVSRLLCRITGAEDAMVVNNNAAAVLLVLSALAAGGEVAVSRGELVEIGGAFRVPDVMAQSGARLREVGTTNKTRIDDYAAVIGPETAALLKVHTSNFKVVGFTEEVGLEALAQLGQSSGLPLIHDLGSGLLDGQLVPDEPTVAQSVRAGADITTFSGDKLLGGPQAGIIIGRAQLVARIKKHPLARAVRIDKLSLAALEATLRLWLDEESRQQVPLVAMLTASPEALLDKCQALASSLERAGIAAAIEEDSGPVGGGSAPGVLMTGQVVALRPRGISLEALEARLRAAQPPIIARISRERLVIDVRTVQREQLEHIGRTLEEILL